jgi:diacylglycerol kinase family enzyme
MEVEEEGLTCLILNAGSLGGVDLHATDKVSVSDGFLDVFIVTTDLSAVQSLASYLLDVGKAQVGVHHWKGKEILVEADPPQTSWIDGELFGPTPYTISVIPKAVPIVVPE